MSKELADKRRSRRYFVEKMGYRASVFVDKQSVELEVLDFSSNGIQIQMPVTTNIPKGGTLRFREQNYHYDVRHEAIKENTKRLGIEMCALPPEEDGLPDLKPVQGLIMSGCETERRLLSLNVGNAFFWSIALIGITFASILLYGTLGSPGSTTGETFWTDLGRSINFSSTYGSSGTAIAGKSSNGGGKASLTPQIKSAIEAVSRAESLLENANYRGVLDACDQAIASNAQNADAWRLRGIALDHLTRHDEAIEALNRALSLKSTDPIIHADLAKAFRNSGQFTAALKQTQRGFELAQGETKARFQQLVAKAYEARAAQRLKDGDADGAQLDRAEAAHWQQ